MSGLAHLARRFVGSLSGGRPDPAPAVAVLTPAELRLWSAFDPADQRHSLLVAERLVAAHPDAPRHERAAALLHDIGKLDAGLGTVGRVVATLVVVGDRGRRYRDHERLGAAMLRCVGSDPRVVALVAGDVSDGRARLEMADDV